MNYTELRTAVEDSTENTFSNTDFATLTKLAEQRIYNSVQLPNLRKTSTLTLVIGNPLLSLPADFLSAFSLAVVEATGNYEFLLNKDVNFIRASYPNPATTGTPRYYALDGTTTPLVQRVILGPTPGAALNAELNYFYYPESIVPINGTLTSLQIGISGSNYTDGTYDNLPLTTSTGTGSGATVTVVVASGSILSVSLINGGSGYASGDTLLLSEALIKSNGSGGNISLTAVGIKDVNPSGTTWLGNNFDSVLFNAVMVEAARFMKQEQDIVAMMDKEYAQSLTLLKNLGDGKDRQDAYRSGQVRTKVM